MNRIYIAGPMRGYPKFNFPLFDEAAAHFRACGWEVVSPAERDREEYADIEQWEGYADGDISKCPKFNFHETIKWDLRQITLSDAICMLPEWEHSSGATIEYTVATTCGLEVYLWPAEG